ncbi:hypothetical protein [Tianweitania sediminis]|uniref:Uncharacterized protein n=1 Tax=Tianweitania sediminis TaxID=1502156 RepID=A0A8J7UMJ3_9HYPH|nr:hypothetical protein [Tianweitania sediminis]MBP0440422.1 hypothetical protein [Tianweitania sediminis]
MIDRSDLHGDPVLRGVYLAAGLLFVALGLIGASRPVLPTKLFLSSA